MMEFLPHDISSVAARARARLGQGRRVVIEAQATQAYFTDKLARPSVIGASSADTRNLSALLSPLA